MRRAVGDIREGMEKLRAKTAREDGNVFASIMIGHGGNHNKYIQELFQSALLASERFQEERGDGLNDVHQRFRSCCNDNDLPIDTVYVQNDGSSWHANNSAKDPINNCGDLSPTVRAENGAYQFKQQFCIRNVPCIIRGLDNSHFADVSIQWRSEIRHSVDSSSVDDNEYHIFEKADKAMVANSDATPNQTSMMSGSADIWGIIHWYLFVLTRTDQPTIYPAIKMTQKGRIMG